MKIDYDLVYNHLVSDLILSKLDKYLIDSNVASRENKGTRYGRLLLHRYICELKRNNKVFYILKFDIKKYFFNIDHDILINKLSKYLNNNKYKLNLPLYKKNKGISIGSVCSQMLAVFYLNDLDHFIIEELGVKYYINALC